MSTPPRLTLAAAALALLVLGCRSEDRTVPPSESRPPSPTPGPSEATPPLIEDDDAIDDDEGSAQEVPPPVGGADPVDPDMPEAVDPGADPKQPPPPSRRDARG